MLHYDIGGKSIDISLSPDMYIMDYDSSVGKSYLREILDGYVSLGNTDVFTYTYNELDNRDKIAIPADVDLIVLDRADKYYDKVDWNCLTNCGAVVLVDLKNSIVLRCKQPQLCFLEFDKDRFLVEK